MITLNDKNLSEKWFDPDMLDRIKFISESDVDKLSEFIFVKNLENIIDSKELILKESIGFASNGIENNLVEIILDSFYGSLNEKLKVIDSVLPKEDVTLTKEDVNEIISNYWCLKLGVNFLLKLGKENEIMIRNKLSIKELAEKKGFEL